MVYLGDIFRASGRFFWSVYYLILFYFIIVFNKIAINKNIKISIVCFLVLIQLIDINPMFNKIKYQLGDYKPKLNITYWDSIFSSFNNIITVIPFNNDLVNFQDYQEIAFFAYKNKNGVTNGNLARYDGDGSTKFSNDLINDLIKGKFSSKNLYVTNKENLKYFSPAYKRGLITITNSDGYYFIYSKNKTLKKLPYTSIKDLKDLEISKKENLKSIEFELCKTPLKPSSGEVKLNFENELHTDLFCQLKGWAFIEKSNNNSGDSIFIYLKNDKFLYKNKCIQSERKDITIVFKKENLDNSGFESFTFLNSIEKGRYELITAIKDKKGNLYYSNNGKVINIGYKDIYTPIKINSTIIENKGIGYGIDGFNFKNHTIKLNGWAAFKEIESKKSMIEIILINKNTIYNVETLSTIRKDVTLALKNNVNYDDSGFETKINTKSLPKGNYTIGIRIINKTFNKDSYVLTDKNITIN